MKLFVFVMVLTVGCASTTSPEGAKVAYSSDQKNVVGCRMLGVVETVGPNNWPSDARKKMQNKVAALGGDTLLITSCCSGVAYQCEGYRQR